MINLMVYKIQNTDLRTYQAEVESGGYEEYAFPVDRSHAPTVSPISRL